MLREMPWNSPPPHIESLFVRINHTSAYVEVQEYARRVGGGVMALTSADKSAIRDMIEAALQGAQVYDPFIPRIEAAKYLGVSEREFDELRARDEIATEQHGSRKVIVRLSELNRYAQERCRSA
ncbi:hypothetical protein ABG82_09245 [Mycobacteroides immunogenum]|uniref:DNA-binding protein n=2 Tax=Mycobacteroides immunogenum TaxID=83262 RepID=A0ABR5LNV1_9MYCO|nr:hypothetical protein ABG82_09245 [Mycobacteroides immunogenum]ANO03557.1 hypothetical protein BAB75_09305 [Mycobacteroides immunogenum]KIU41981.1 hypothetical protein TL11_02340 [Mycobacteroides immunogenum]KPG13574.1 hypothetical protein AN909_04575 [Mycobacteroides immunogenum]KPG17289.1 hypothetical protein AN910_03800 [Mycobacteroides immunogenum]